VNAEDRQTVIGLIDEAMASGARQSKACVVIDLAERRLRNWRKSGGDGRTGGYRAKDQALSAAEKDAIVEAFSAPDLKDLPPKQAFIRLLDRGVYLGSYSSFLRVLKEREVVGCKGHRNGTGNKKRPELAATAPNQIWCWDITWLGSRTKGKYFYLYMIIDMYSRKVVGWTVAARENGGVAKALFARTLEAEGVSEDQLIVHSDNGKPMRSRTLRALYKLLSVAASYGRPHTSNDNVEDIIHTGKRVIDWMKDANAQRLTLTLTPPQDDPGIIWDEVIDCYSRTRTPSDAGAEMIERHLRGIPRR
jgi:putative transposase